MRFEVEWHKTSKELPSPWVDCYLAVLDDPSDDELMVVFGHYVPQNDNFVSDMLNITWEREQVKYWTARLTPWVDELRENDEI